jgi:S1-C subfamily serine protease
LISRSLLCAFVLAAPAALAQSAPPEPPGALTALDAFDVVTSKVIEQVASSVVLIEVERAAAPSRRLTAQELMMLGLGNAYPDRYFTRPEGPCTGVVVGPKLIATSCWNVEGEGAVHVLTSDGARHAARRLGRDENLDVALLEVDAEGLVPLRVAPEAPVVGRFVFLVARTAQNGPYVTEGIVAGLGRHRGDSFAHSARTSYQNVGGALVDLEGRLLGIAVRHTDRARQGQSSGVGFGAPALVVQRQLTPMAAGQVVVRRKTPFLGIQGDPGDEDEGGVKIGAIVPGGAAAAIGLQPGDVILVFNSVAVLNFMQLREEIMQLEVGATIVITIRRGDQELDLTVKLGERDAEDQ